MFSGGQFLGEASRQWHANTANIHSGDLADCFTLHTPYFTLYLLLAIDQTISGLVWGQLYQFHLGRIWTSKMRDNEPKRLRVSLTLSLETACEPTLSWNPTSGVSFLKYLGYTAMQKHIELGGYSKQPCYRASAIYFMCVWSKSMSRDTIRPPLCTKTLRCLVLPSS